MTSINEGGKGGRGVWFTFHNKKNRFTIFMCLKKEISHFTDNEALIKII
jgi:hypothetical protein